MTVQEQLENAAKNGQLEIVKEILHILKEDITPYILNSIFTDASAYGHLAIVKYLLTLDNPKVDYRAENDYAFRWAAAYGHLDVVKHLLTLDNPKVDYRARNEWAFKWAARNGHLNVINHLLTLPNIEPSVNDFLAVVRALENHHLPVVEAIARWVRVHGTTIERNRLDAILGNHSVVINYEQSTHAASVHKSVSESVNRLMTRYGDDIKGNKLPLVLEQMLTYVNGLASSREVIHPAGAAQRYLNGEPTEAYPTFTGNAITPRPGSRFLFVDKDSNVTTQQLLALTYLAALDEKAHPETNVQEALQSFVRGLYEARRGYNLNDKGQDNGLADRMICPPGAFNKAIEVLAAVHPDCEIVLVTKAQASLKLPKVAEEEVFGYLEAQLKDTTSVSSLESFMALLSQAQSEGMGIIVSKVKEKISDRLFEEFGLVYSDDREHENFKALVDSAEHMPVNETRLNALFASAKTRLEDLTPKVETIHSARAILPMHSKRPRVPEQYSDAADKGMMQSKRPHAK